MDQSPVAAPLPRAARYVSWGGFHGYPTAAVHYLGALVSAGLAVSWDVIVSDGRHGWRLARSRREARRAARLGSIEGVDRSALDAAIRCRHRGDVEVLHVVPELWAQFSRGGRPAIGNTVWETDRLPEHWPGLLNDVDAVIVPTEFNREVFVASGVHIPVCVVPHIAAPAPEPVSDREMAGFRRRHRIPGDHRLVYTIEAWTARKAPWKSVRAFVAAFDATDGVTMVLKGPTRAQSSAVDIGTRRLASRVEEIRAGVAEPPPVRVVTGDVSDREIQVLHAAADCYLSLSHGEGWGLSVFDAAASGNPVVTTGWGGVLEYLGATWPFLVDFELVPVIDVAGAASFSPDQRWASAEIDHAVELLRTVVGDPAAAATRCEPVTSVLRERYSARAVTPALLSALETATESAS